MGVSRSFSLSAVCVLLTSLSPAAELTSDVLARIHFRSIGPTRQGGRIMDFGVPDPKLAPNTFYAAASTGGLWKTTDAGLTYTPVFDDVAINAIGDVAVAPSDPNAVWVGTGNMSYWGEGLFFSPDAGASWEPRGLERSYSITRIVVDPRDAATIYVAANGSPITADCERGLYKTTDAGHTWHKSLDVRVEGRCVGAADVVMDPRNSQVLYATSWDHETGQGTGIHKTVDAGASWIRLEDGLPAAPLERIGLDIYRSNPDVVVACILLPGEEGASPYDMENTVYRTDDAGGSWRRLNPPREEFKLRGAPRFAQIRIDPNDDQRIFVLNTGAQGTFDGGRTWRRTIRYGGDNQAMWINPHDSAHMLLGYDYGLAISRSGGETWFHPDNLPLGQLEAVGYDMEYPYNVYGGMQDFGTWKGPSTKRGRFPIRFEDWEHVKGADGSYAQVDPRDSRWLYVESQFGHMTRNDQRSGVRSEIQYEREGLRFNFIAPILLSPHDPDVLYHGANVLLRSPFRGQDWKEISPDLTNGPSKLDRYVSGAITTIAESPVTAGVIWVGTDDGNLQLTRDGGESWTLLNAQMPDKPEYRVSRVEASHHAPGRAYVSLEGRRTHHDLRPFLYATDDYGESFRSISEGLPPEPINVVREDPRNPDLLFVGTAKSIYVSLDAGASWHPMRNDMPNVPIHDLAIHPRENDLIVGTYGRSFWIADISALQELTPDVLEEDVHLFAVEPQVLWIHAGQTQVAHAYQNYPGENAPKGAVVNYYLKRAASEVRVEIRRGSVLINEYSGPTEAGLNHVEWYLTRRIPRTEEEKLRFEKGWARQILEEEEFFDYYDGTDHFGPAGAEVSVYGRPLDIWIHPLPDWRERDYKHLRATPGEYTVKLVVDGVERVTTARVLADHWY